MSGKKWPIEHPDRIQLYSLATPNGQKAGIALEELGLAYEAHKVNILENEQFSEEFIAVCPNSKIPAMVDPDGPGGKPLSIFESGAMLLYLAEKTGKLLPADPHRRSECIQWLFFQMAGVGPMFGQFGHFYKFAKERIPYPTERYTSEARRLLGVLEKRLDGREYLVGDEYTIADIATFPWVGCLDWGYGAREDLKLDADFPMWSPGMHVAPRSRLRCGGPRCAAFRTIRLMETDSGPDLVVDIFIDGRLVNPSEIPTAVVREIETLASASASGRLTAEGVVYEWSTRPCVYP